MTHPALIERITRSLAYMLRHQPDKFGLQLDAHGFGEIHDVVAALGEKLGEPITAADLEEAIAAGDRPRYEIRGTTVRALYGHSIQVEPGEPSQPPEFLYVGIDSRDATRATQFGLRGGRRRFLHLALNVDDAREAGRRAGREYAVVRIYALDAWEDGVNFYDRRALFLAEQIPTQFLEVLETHDDGYEPQQPPHDERGGGGRFEHGGRREHGHGGHGRGERRPDRRDDRRGPPREHAPRREAAPVAFGSAPAGEMGAREQRGEPRTESRGEPRGERHDRGGRGGPPRGGFGGRRDAPMPPRERSADERPRETEREVERGGERVEANRGGERPERPRDDFGGGGEARGRFGRGPRRDDRGPREQRPAAPPPSAPPEPRREAPARSQSSSDAFGEGVFDSSAPARSAPKPQPPAAPPPPPPVRSKPAEDAGDFGAGI
jgi:putative RNA 2'-phosphotransferase